VSDAQRGDVQQVRAGEKTGTEWLSNQPSKYCAPVESEAGKSESDVGLYDA
jgi:hypothetical protein